MNSWSVKPKLLILGREGRMKTVAAVLAFACLAQCAFGVVDKPVRTCSGAPTTQCSAVSTLQIEVTRGRCTGTSSASCKTWEQSQRTFQDAFEEWWSEGDKVCDGNTVQATAQAIATAIAKVWTSAAVAVDCDEKFQGFSCGWSFANGEAFGSALAEAAAVAAADASSTLEAAGDPGAQVADAFCYSDIRAIGAGFATAAANAHTDACQRTGDGPVEKYESSFVSSIQTVVANALARASARVCQTPDGADVSAESKCFGDGSVKEDGTFEGDGDFCFGLEAVPACEGKGEAACCTEKRANSRSRLCMINGCRKCKGPWKKVSDVEFGLQWQNTAGKKCFCKDL